MKSRVIFVLLLLVALFVLISQKNQTTHNAILKVINPIKQFYKQITQEVENRSQSYIFQKENIEKLAKENKILKKYLLDQTIYLKRVNTLYKKLPSIEKLPYKSITLVDTISYIKLNSFNEILLTIPEKHKLVENKVYGLIQNNTIGGTAILEKGNLYGYLSSNPRCKFAVFIGANRTPGIVQGVDKDSMFIKYIPKWANIKEGDKVETSGLDGIFFANIPVGVVKRVKVENSYKTAYIESYSDALHPNFFFLITDTKPRLVSYYDQNTSFPNTIYSASVDDKNSTEDNITSIPKTLQTKESEVDLSEFEIPKERIKIKPITSNEASQQILESRQKSKVKLNKFTPKQAKKELNIDPEEPKIEKPAPKPKRRNPLDIFR